MPAPALVRSDPPPPPSGSHVMRSDTPPPPVAITGGIPGRPALAIVEAPLLMFLNIFYLYYILFYIKNIKNYIIFYVFL